MMMTTRAQFFLFLRNCRWVIAVAAFVSLLLAGPDQVHELYRIAAADYGWQMAEEFLSVVLIALILWLGTLQLSTLTKSILLKNNSLTPRSEFLFRLTPAVIGVLPIIAAIVGNILSRPSAVLTPAQKAISQEIGSIHRIEWIAISYDRLSLAIFATLFGLLGSAFLFIAMRLSQATKLNTWSDTINRRYFDRGAFAALTILAIVFLTVLFVWIPDRIAQSIGTFGIVALFTLCVTGFVIHASLKTIEHNVPYIPLILLWAVLVAWFGRNDDHALRLIDHSALPRQSAISAFEIWIKQPTRVAESQKRGEYPVFIVTAQGGGIYAAQNAAKFLARTQDLCPAFRQHIFAMSTVSGGSVGAATFAAATAVDIAKSQSDDAPACQNIADFLNGVARLSKLQSTGETEQRVDSILSSDFLAPLTAGFLFTDFSQTFLPLPVKELDRARFLEYSLENAAEKAFARADGVVSQNLLKQDFQSRWTPDGQVPALLINTTDVGSGKRVVISPFDLDPNHPKDVDVCTLANVSKGKDAANGIISSKSLALPLSAAAFASARFPWVTPAATVAIKNECITKLNTYARLVDGGYAENSGTQTALDLIEKIKVVAGTADVPKFRIYLISLATGDFSDHGSRSFSEIMEPIRALLSSRTSRTYSALNRAALFDGPPAESAANPKFNAFAKLGMSDVFYSLPLGWTLSSKTADIVSQSSGRFWDCLPDSNFSQTRNLMSNADCTQIQVFHLLNGTVRDAFKAQRDAERANAYVSALTASQQSGPPNNGPLQASAPKFSDKVILCYEKNWLQARHREQFNQISEKREREQISARAQGKPELPFPVFRETYLTYFQAENLRSLINEWEAGGDKDTNVLAYALGSVSYDSADFTRTSENLSFNKVEQIPQRWKDRISQINDAAIAAGKPPVPLGTFVNKPMLLANTVWGKGFDNKSGTDDGWNYRPRGMYQLVGRGQYSEADKQIKDLGSLPGLELMDFPDALWNAKISAKVTLAHLRKHQYHDGSLWDSLKNGKEFAEVRALQVDMDHGPTDQVQVGEKSKMFANCILAASKNEAIADKINNYIVRPDSK
ncbi:MAG: hypothetical protein HY242_01485 [Afipia sp.]|nr:hypothetical protein [Afipia sp.]